MYLYGHVSHQRYRSAIAGALHAAKDTAIWVPSGPDVEKECQAALDKASQLEKDANIAQKNEIARKRYNNILSAGPAATARGKAVVSWLNAPISQASLFL